MSGEIACAICKKKIADRRANGTVVAVLAGIAMEWQGAGRMQCGHASFAGRTPQGKARMARCGAWTAWSIDQRYPQA